MTVKGHIQGGTLILEEPIGLADGTPVEVEVRPRQESADPPATWGEVFADVIGSVDDLPPDFSINHDHYIHGTPKKEPRP